MKKSDTFGEIKRISPNDEFQTLLYERTAIAEGFKAVCGIDEAGRGPLAGPVCAAAVILPPDTVIEGVKDSKKLSEKKREQLYDIIKENSLAYSIAFASVQEIEEFNILGATMLAMKRACEGLKPIGADFALIDGNKLPPLDITAYALVSGDSKSLSISAASILAKVTRDRLLLEYAEKYPEYAFERHKGYGTAAHIELIKKYGPSPVHRPSFLKKIKFD